MEQTRNSLLTISIQANTEEELQKGLSLLINSLKKEAPQGNPKVLPNEKLKSSKEKTTSTLPTFQQVDYYTAEAFRQRVAKYCQSVSGEDKKAIVTAINTELKANNLKDINQAEGELLNEIVAKLRAGGVDL